MKFYTILFFILAILNTGCTSPQKPTPKKKSPKKIEQTTTELKKVVDKKTEEAKPTNKEKSKPTPPEHLKKAESLIAKYHNSIEGIDAKKIFKFKCSVCHGIKGNMKVNGAKDLTKSNTSLIESVAQVYHGKGSMTPFADILTDEEIVAVSKYCETLRK